VTVLCTIQTFVPFTQICKGLIFGTRNRPSCLRNLLHIWVIFCQGNSCSLGRSSMQTAYHIVTPLSVSTTESVQSIMAAVVADVSVIWSVQHAAPARPRAPSLCRSFVQAPDDDVVEISNDRITRTSVYRCMLPFVRQSVRPWPHLQGSLSAPGSARRPTFPHTRSALFRVRRRQHPTDAAVDPTMPLLIKRCRPPTTDADSTDVGFMIKFSGFKPHRRTEPLQS